MATEAKKERLRKQRERGKCEVDDFCREHGIRFDFITEYHIRLYGEKAVVDIYPTNRKYSVRQHGWHAQTWGQYKELSEILEHL